MKFSLIAAVDKQFGIGKNNALPWRLPSDLKHFSRVTTEIQNPGKLNAVIMGRKTWDSLPAKHRPLKDRLNVVLSREKSLALPSDVILASSLEEAMKTVSARENIENIFVIGGGKVYEQAIQHPDCAKIYLTQVDAIFDCDAFFPSRFLQENFNLKESTAPQVENGLSFNFSLFEK